MRSNEIIYSMINHEFDFLSLLNEFDKGMKMPDDGYAQIKQYYFDQVDKRNNYESKKRCIERMIEKLNYLLSNLSVIASANKPDSCEKVHILIEDLAGELEIAKRELETPSKTTKISKELIHPKLKSKEWTILLYHLIENGAFSENVSKEEIADSIHSITGYSSKDIQNNLTPKGFELVNIPPHSNRIKNLLNSMLGKLNH